MKKTLLFLTLIFLATNFTSLYAQFKAKTAVPVSIQKPKFRPNNLSSLGPQGDGGCDTLNLAAAANWQAFYYTNLDGGYTFGTSDNANNGYNVNEDANQFNVSSNDYNYITGGLIYFAFANSNVPADLDKDVLFKIYDDAGGYPGNLLGSTSLKLSQIKQDVENNFLTEFSFSSPVAIPASKIFYVSVDHSNFVWDGTTRDSIAIIANNDDDTTAAAYQFIDIDGSGNTWFAVNEIYGSVENPLDVNLYIFPYVSNALGACAVLPVSMLNFGGSIKDYQANLNWSTATESNNKGFYIERSKDGRNFSSIGFVNGAGNSTQIKNYTYSDGGLKDINVSTTFYRIKQVDLDGKYTYSKVLALNLKNTLQNKIFPNPVKDVATVELNLTASAKVNVQVVSRDGKVLINADKGTLNQGTQQVFINTQSLAKGSYIVKVTAGDKTFTQSLIKE